MKNLLRRMATKNRQARDSRASIFVFLGPSGSVYILHENDIISALIYSIQLSIVKENFLWFLVFHCAKIIQLLRKIGC